jgi:hypothetical protein
MDKFDNEYKDKYLQYHHKPFIKNELDPRVFSYSDDGSNPKLVDLVRTSILNDIDQLNQVEDIYSSTRVKDYVIFGHILDKGSSDRCPIQVMIEVNTNNLEDVLKERLLQKVKELNGRIVPGTTHPVHYTLTIRPIDFTKYISAYKPFTNEWVKRPRFLGN